MAASKIFWWRYLFHSFILVQCAYLCVGSELQDENIAGCKPERVHLSYGDSALEVVVMWETQKSCSSPNVEYGIGGFNVDLSANGDTQDLSGCGGDNCTLTFVHSVALKDLSPSSTVFYFPVSNGVKAGPFYFHVPGKDETKPLQFLVTSISTQGTQDVMLKSLEKVIYQHPYSGVFLLNKPDQLVCISGPIVRGFVNDGQASLCQLISEATIMCNGENVLTQVEQLATDLPLMIGADAEQDDQECLQGLFPMPGQGLKKKPSRKRWYSLDVGMVHFIVYSSKVFLEKDPKQGKAMQTWMIEDLTKANKKRSLTPWVIAIGSDPMYCQAEIGSESEGVRDCARNDSLIRHGLEDLFYSFAVDLVLELQPGVYERTWPHYKRVRTAKSYEQPASPVEVVLAQGVLPDEPPAAREDGNETVKVVNDDWTAVKMKSVANSYGHLSVFNVSHLHFEWRQSTSAEKGGQVVLDEFWLVQEHHGNFSLATLPHNVSHKINQSIIAMGGKPGTYDFINTMAPGGPGSSQDGEGWSKYSLWFGLGCVAIAIVVGLGVATIRSYIRRRRSNAGRRWREVDRQGGDGSGHFYSMASDSDSDENDRDFEIDMFERTSKSESKLLTSY